MILFSERSKEIGEYLKDHTLGEFEREHNIVDYDYTGVGYGYQLKENSPSNEVNEKNSLNTSILDEIEAMSE